MRYFFNFNISQRYYELTDEVLIYENVNRMAREKKTIRWDKIIGAGYYRMSKHTEDTPMTGLNQVMPPGLSHFMNMSLNLQRMSDMILVVYQQVGNRRAMLYMHIKVDDPEAHELVADMQRRLGARWHNEIDDMNRYRREMGLSNGWVWILVALFLVLGGALLITAIIGWDMIQERWGLYILAGAVFISGILWLWRWIRNRPRKS